MSDTALIQILRRIFPRIWASRTLPSKHWASMRPFPSIRVTQAYSECLEIEGSTSQDVMWWIKNITRRKGKEGREESMSHRQTLLGSVFRNEFSFLHVVSLSTLTLLPSLSCKEWIERRSRAGTRANNTKKRGTLILWHVLSPVTKRMTTG